MSRYINILNPGIFIIPAIILNAAGDNILCFIIRRYIYYDPRLDPGFQLHYSNPKRHLD